MECVKVYIGGHKSGTELYNMLECRDEVLLCSGRLWEFNEDIYTYVTIRSKETDINRFIKDISKAAQNSKNVAACFIEYDKSELDRLKEIIKYNAKTDINIFSDMQEIVTWTENKINTLLGSGTKNMTAVDFLNDVLKDVD